MRFYGAVGYATSQEVTPGVWKDVITEINYQGDVFRDSRRLESSAETLNNNISVENSFSILADAYALENFLDMRYIVWQGHRWTVATVEDRRPRLILTIGGLWNGNTP